MKKIKSRLKDLKKESKLGYSDLSLIDEIGDLGSDIIERLTNNKYESIIKSKPYKYEGKLYENFISTVDTLYTNSFDKTVADIYIREMLINTTDALIAANAALRALDYQEVEITESLITLVGREKVEININKEFEIEYIHVL